MDLDVRHAATLLNASEDDVYRWVRTAGLPFHRIHDQLRFNRVELQEWAASNHKRISPEVFSSGLDVAAAIERGGAHVIEASTREGALEAVSRLAAIPQGVDRAVLLKLLLARETLSSTGLGQGIAFPHPRDPLVLPIDEPCVVVGYLANPIDFDAIDGLLVHVLFTILSPSVRAHLQALAKLAFILHDGELKALLGAKAGAGALAARIRAFA